MYLDNLFDVAAEKDTKDLHTFYQVLVQMLGASNADGEDLSVEFLKKDTQRVATNFLAIYTAEQYRSIVPKPFKNWDDALLEVTLLGAFHGGQTTFAKYYLGEFTAQSKKQASGVYARVKPGTLFCDAKTKEAEMNDYWQFSFKPDSKQSGINVTRRDFELMGKAITEYESTVAKNKTLKRIQSVVGGDKSNVIKAISKYFTEGKSELSEIDDLAKDVADFMMDVRKDADDITEWLAPKKSKAIKNCAE
jgi:hypothetical protein